MAVVYMAQTALDKAKAHFSSEAKKGLEAMGLLLGEVNSFNGKEYSFIADYITSKNDATSVTVRFSENAFSNLAAEINSVKPNLVVGWAHSHPNYGCFLSSTDVSTQKKYFSQGYNVALVIDPVRGEKKFFKLNANGYQEVGFAIVRKC
ncbi:hypothetical protein HY993_02095 [Candidatus Micrarchaeota archaeon]|nr:hypothetical protein [Candidatus Micrarchaeota archaeon]